MTRSAVVSGLALVLMVAILSDAGAETGPANQEARTRAAEAALWLEEDPLRPGADALREDLVAWLGAVPDLRLDWCDRMLAEAGGDRIRSVMAAQARIAGGAYLLRNPDRAGDRLAVALAGVGSALRAYESAVAADPSLRDSFLDSLLRKARGKQLEAYVRERLEECAARAPGGGPPQADGGVRVYEVFGMDCPGCHGGLEKLLKKIPAVLDAEANWKKQSLVVTVRPGASLQDAEVHDAIRRANFTVGRRLE